MKISCGSTIPLIALLIFAVCDIECQSNCEINWPDSFPPIHTPNNTDYVESTLMFLDTQFEQFSFAKQKDLVLILGDSKAAKTTLALFLTGAEVNAVEESPGNFEFVDRYGLIKADPEMIIPTLFDDTESGTEYYVCPWSNSDVDVKNEITTLYFTQRVYKFARSVKFVFTVDDTSFQSTSYVEEFIKTATYIISNVDKFRSAIALVVTNVNDDKDIDTNTIEYIAYSIQKASRNLGEIERKFVQALLEETDFQRNRISLFRVANKAGSVMDMPFLVDEINLSLRILHDNVHFVDTNNSDFGYPISGKSKLVVLDLIIYMQKRLELDVMEFSADIKSYYVELEKKVFDLNVIFDKISLGHQYLSQIHCKEPRLFAEKLIESINASHIEIQYDKLKFLINNIELAELLNVLSNSSSFEASNGLDDIKMYLNESRTWYNFAITLHDFLSNYSVQKRVSEYQIDAIELMAQFTIEEYETKNIDDTGLKDFLERIDRDNQLYQNVRNMTVNAYKFRAVKNILNQTLNNDLVALCLPDKKLVIQGYIVKLSDIGRIECGLSAESLDFFALNKLLIDVNPEQLETKWKTSLLAPSWDIIEDTVETTLNSNKSLRSNAKRDCGRELKYIKSSYIINAYKNYARENLANHIWETVLLEFLNDLNEIECVQSLYDTDGYADELLLMENQYFALRNDISFIPFYESLLNRTVKYANSIKRRDNLLLICTATSSKLSALNNVRIGVSLTIYEHFELLKENIYKLQSIETNTSAIEYHMKHKAAVRDKIKSVMEFFKKEIKWKVRNIGVEVKAQIPKLIDEIISHSNEVHRNENVLAKKRRELKKFVRSHCLSNVAEIMNAFYELFGSVGAAFVDATEREMSIPNIFVSDKQLLKMQWHKLIFLVNLSISEMNLILRREYHLYLQQLNDIKVDVEGDESLEEIVLIRVNHLITYVTERLKTDDILDPSSISEMRIGLHNMVVQNPSNEVVSNILRINSMSNIDLDVYKQVRFNSTRMKIMAEALNGQTICQGADIKIYEIIIPKAREIQNDIRCVFQSITNDSFVDRDLQSKWNIVKTLRDFKVVWSEMVQRMILPEFLDKSTIKLYECIDMLIEIYDFINSFFAKVRFVAYYVAYYNEINLPVGHIFSEIREMIPTNRILEQFETAINALRQHQFPFAHFYSNIYELLSDVNFKDIELVMKKINLFQKQFENSHFSVGNYDVGIYRNVYFDANNSTIGKPFFMWKSRKMQDEIGKLLQGEEVVIYADISRGVHRSAVKFNEIGLQFEVENQNVHDDFRSELKHFGITMTMVGNNYYRCGSSVYFILADDNVETSYSFKNDMDGKPSTTNEVYKQIAGKVSFFSPYGLWIVRLIKLDNESPHSRDFKNLNKFKNEIISIKLTGRGQYFERKREDLLQICDSHLNEFYNFDASVSMETILKELKYHHLP